MTGYDRAGGARMRGYSLSEIDIEHIMRQDFTATCTDGDTVAYGDGVPHARFYGTMPRKIPATSSIAESSRCRLRSAP